MENPSQSYEASPDIWYYKVIHATRHRRSVNAPHLDLSQNGRYSIYLSGRDGKLSWPWCWLYTGMIYLSADSHPSENKPLDSDTTGSWTNNLTIESPPTSHDNVCGAVTATLPLRELTRSDEWSTSFRPSQSA